MSIYMINDFQFTLCMEKYHSDTWKNTVSHKSSHLKCFTCWGCHSKIDDEGAGIGDIEVSECEGAVDVLHYGGAKEF